MRRAAEYARTRDTSVSPTRAASDGDLATRRDPNDAPGFTWGERFWIAGQRARALARRVWRRLLPP
jgi:hypothetical protein